MLRPIPMWCRFIAECMNSQIGSKLGYFSTKRYITTEKLDEDKYRLTSKLLDDRSYSGREIKSIWVDEVVDGH